jgi:hypothetical protein
LLLFTFNPPSDEESDRISSMDNNDKALSYVRLGEIGAIRLLMEYHATREVAVQ